MVSHCNIMVTPTQWTLGHLCTTQVLGVSAGKSSWGQDWYPAGGCAMSHKWRCGHLKSHLDLTRYRDTDSWHLLPQLLPGPHYTAG